MIKSVTRKEFTALARSTKEALKLASTHDPDLVQWIVDTQSRVTKLELQLEKLKEKK